MSMRLAVLLIFTLFGTSSALANDRPPGADCTFDSDCASGECHWRLNLCEMPGGGLPVDCPCTFDSDCYSDECDDGWCVFENGKLPAGAPCTFDSDCHSDECHWREKLCELPGGGLPIGASCVFDSDCASDECDDNRCSWGMSRR